MIVSVENTTHPEFEPLQFDRAFAFEATLKTSGFSQRLQL